MALGSTVVFISVLICGSFSREIEVVFELEDSDVNEVIFVNERDIVLRCFVTGGSSEFVIRIEHTNTDTDVALARNENCLEFVIKKVSMNDRGEYTCNVSYIDVNGATKSKANTLYLNVQDGLVPQCFRNGTSGEPYQAGDLLLMSCYCQATQSCRWISGVPGSGRAERVTPFETKNRSDKMILRLLVNVGSSTLFTSTTRYECFNGVTSAQRCKIGPQNESSTDVVINSHAVDTFADPLDCELLSTSTVTSQKEELTTSLNAIRNTSRTGESTRTLISTPGTVNTEVDAVLIGISVGIGIVFVLIIILIIVFYLVKRNKNGKNETGQGNNHLYSKNVYTTDQHGNVNGSADSYYYGIDSTEEASQNDDHSKSGGSVEVNTYMRTIIQN